MSGDRRPATSASAISALASPQSMHFIKRIGVRVETAYRLLGSAFGNLLRLFWIACAGRPPLTMDYRRTVISREISEIDRLIHHLKDINPVATQQLRFLRKELEIFIKEIG